MKKIITLTLLVLSLNLFAENSKNDQLNSMSIDLTYNVVKLLSPDTVCFTIMYDYNDEGEETGHTVQTWNTIGDLNCEESFGLIMLIWAEMNS